MVTAQLRNSLKRLPHPLNNHSSPCRPHCVTVPELLDRDGRGGEDMLLALVGFARVDEEALSVEEDV